MAKNTISLEKGVLKAMAARAKTEATSYFLGSYELRWTGYYGNPGTECDDVIKSSVAVPENRQIMLYSYTWSALFHPCSDTDR